MFIYSVYDRSRAGWMMIDVSPVVSDACCPVIPSLSGHSIRLGRTKEIEASDLASNIALIKSWCFSWSCMKGGSGDRLIQMVVVHFFVIVYIYIIIIIYIYIIIYALMCSFNAYVEFSAWKPKKLVQHSGRCRLSPVCFSCCLRCCFPAGSHQRDENTSKKKCNKSGWANHRIPGQSTEFRHTTKSSKILKDSRWITVAQQPISADLTCTAMCIDRIDSCCVFFQPVRTTSWWCTFSWTGTRKWGRSRSDAITWARWTTKNRSSRRSRPWSKASQANWNKALAILPDPGRPDSARGPSVELQRISKWT